MDASKFIPKEDYTVPIGKAAVLKEGKDVSIFSTLMMLYKSLAVAEQLEQEEISCEVVDLRTLVPLDKETVFESIQKTGRAVIVEESPKTGGWGGEVAAVIAEEASEYLIAPIKRVAALDTPVPFSACYGELLCAIQRKDKGSDISGISLLVLRRKNAV